MFFSKKKMHFLINENLYSWKIRSSKITFYLQGGQLLYWSFSRHTHKKTKYALVLYLTLIMFDIRIISPSLFLWEYYNTKNRYQIKITYRNATIKLLLSFFEARHSSFVETLAKDHVYLLNNTLTSVMISTAHICMLNVPMRYFHHFLSDVPLSAGTQHPFWS